MTRITPAKPIASFADVLRAYDPTFLPFAFPSCIFGRAQAHRLKR